ncbi:MAG: hypothetical protein LQ351_004605 [Letrouitia transgressa]|nr:MAG: hypothetical protein LQ351_004605 [Letrouitia transgressa]
MATTAPQSLTWSSQFDLIKAEKTPHLKGDKIVLPQSALEQLLNAATVTVPTATRPLTSSFDSFNPYSYAAEQQARSELYERQQQLPYPLTFRLVNPANSKAVYAGIREFSAEEGQVGVSPFIRQSLGFDEYQHQEVEAAHIAQQDGERPEPDAHARLTVHAEQLPKGTYVRLRPLEAGYDPDDWKALLEKHLRDNFTTLTTGEVLTISTGTQTFCFLVDSLKPNDKAVSLIDTDLEVDIEALNEEQARETLRQRAEKSQRAPGTAQGSSLGGLVTIGENLSGQVKPGEYVDYVIEHWDHSKNISIELEVLDVDDDSDIFVSPAGPRQRSKPREEEHIFCDVSSRLNKHIKIRHTNTELEDAEALWISVRGYRASGDTVPGQSENPTRFNMCVGMSDANLGKNNVEDDFQPRDDEDRCKNCHQWVPRRTMMLHENFCYRNNVLCPKCSYVFQKSSSAWKNHWHCPHDSEYGNTGASKFKHDALVHTTRDCPLCSYSASNALDLAHHRTTVCPCKTILCRFCHLLVPQQGPEEPDINDPEVVISGLTPHELVDGGRTTECHLCSKIFRLRDMATHLKHHDLQRLSRPKPQICRNVNCGRTVGGLDSQGELTGRQSPARNELGVCDSCFGPLYANTYDPDGRALKRRVERRYLTQMLTGCGKGWCHNAFCKSGRKNLGMNEAKGPKDAMGLIKPVLDGMNDLSASVSFCTDEGSQRKRNLAEMIVMETPAPKTGKRQPKDIQVSDEGYDLEWAVAALEATGGDLVKARGWLNDRAPTRVEATR